MRLLAEVAPSGSEGKKQTHHLCLDCCQLSPFPKYKINNSSLSWRHLFRFSLYVVNISRCRCFPQKISMAARLRLDDIVKKNRVHVMTVPFIVLSYV